MPSCWCPPLDVRELEAGPRTPTQKAFARPATDAPRIEVRRPERLDAVRSPVNIELCFVSPDGVAVDLATLRVLYVLGFLSKDLTDRVTQHARFDQASGCLTAEGATLPTGRHVLRVEIADVRGRLARREIEFVLVR